MAREKKSIRSLQKHQRQIELSLADFRRGRKTDHLTANELSQLICGLESRLSAVKQRLHMKAPKALHGANAAKGASTRHEPVMVVEELHP